MHIAALLEKTCAQFPRFSASDVTVVPLEKGGSDRYFYRIENEAGDGLILVKYGDQREENRQYVAIAEYLTAQRINVPEIYHHDAAQGLIWMQDLGEIDLWAHRADSWEKRRHFYHQTLIQAAHLHSLDPEAGGSILQPAFDARLYQWEQNYFFENCLSRHFGVSCDPTLFPFAAIAERLAALPRVLVHRDFQSQNIMLREGNAWLIDFQGLRPGLPQYDLASLLYDPYVELSAQERADLLEFYQSYAKIEQPDFHEIFQLCALQRLLQALGAYGFLGYVKGKPEFLRHIPKALQSLREVVSQIDVLEDFGKVLERL